MGGELHLPPRHRELQLLFYHRGHRGHRGSRAARLRCSVPPKKDLRGLGECIGEPSTLCPLCPLW